MCENFLYRPILFYFSVSPSSKQAAITHLPKEVVAKERKARAIRKSDHLVVLTLLARPMLSRLLQFLIHMCIHQLFSSFVRKGPVRHHIPVEAQDVSDDLSPILIIHGWPHIGFRFKHEEKEEMVFYGIHVF